MEYCHRRILESVPKRDKRFRSLISTSVIQHHHPEKANLDHTWITSALVGQINNKSTTSLIVSPLYLGSRKYIKYPGNSHAILQSHLFKKIDHAVLFVQLDFHRSDDHGPQTSSAVHFQQTNSKTPSAQEPCGLPILHLIVCFSQLLVALFVFVS